MLLEIIVRLVKYDWLTVVNQVKEELKYVCLLVGELFLLFTGVLKKLVLLVTMQALEDQVK